jgi:hypothetical protein
MIKPGEFEKNCVRSGCEVAVSIIMSVFDERYEESQAL